MRKKKRVENEWKGGKEKQKLASLKDKSNGEETKSRALKVKNHKGGRSKY